MNRWINKRLESSGISVVAGYDIDASCQYVYETSNKSNPIEVITDLPDIANWIIDET